MRRAIVVGMGIMPVVIASDGCDMWERDLAPAARSWVCFVCGMVNPAGGRVAGCFPETGFPVLAVCTVARPCCAVTVNAMMDALGFRVGDFMAPGGLVAVQGLAPVADIPQEA